MNVSSDLIQRNSVSKHKQWDTETIGTRRYKKMGRAGLNDKKKNLNKYIGREMSGCLVLVTVKFRN